MIYFNAFNSQSVFKKYIYIYIFPGYQLTSPQSLLLCAPGLGKKNIVRVCFGPLRLLVMGYKSAFTFTLRNLQSPAKGDQEQTIFLFQRIC